MQRSGMLALLVMASAASADPAPLTPAQVKVFEKRGYKAPVIVFESAALKLARANKHAKPRLVVLSAAGALVDGGPVGAGKLSVTAPTTPGAAGLTVLELGYHRALADGASDTRATLWVVRDNGTIACEVSGGSSNSIGNACGSSGWTSAKATLTPGAFNTVTLDVRYDVAGHWSVSDGKGGCVSRSPINHAHTQRWTIPARGKCKQAAAPKPAEPEF